MNLEMIKQLCFMQSMTMKELAERVGISEPGIHQSLRTGSMKVDVLQSICTTLNADPSIFFDKASIKPPEPELSDQNLLDMLKQRGYKGKLTRVTSI